MIRVEQGARQHRQAVAQAGRRLRIAGVFRRAAGAGPGRCGAGRGTRGSSRVLDAAVLEEFHRHALERAPVVGDLRPGSSAGGRPCGRARRGSGRVPLTPLCVVVAHRAGGCRACRNTASGCAQLVVEGTWSTGSARRSSCHRPRRYRSSWRSSSTSSVPWRSRCSTRAAVGRLQAEVVDLALGMVRRSCGCRSRPSSSVRPATAGRAGAAPARRTPAGPGWGRSGVVAVDGAGGALHELERRWRGSAATARATAGAARPRARLCRNGAMALPLGDFWSACDGCRDGGQRVLADERCALRPLGQKDQHRLAPRPSLPSMRALDVGVQPLGARARARASPRQSSNTCSTSRKAACRAGARNQPCR